MCTDYISLHVKYTSSVRVCYSTYVLVAVALPMQAAKEKQPTTFVKATIKPVNQRYILNRIVSVTVIGVGLPF